MKPVRSRRARTVRGRRLRNRSGVTLVELLVATVIISIGLLAIVGTSAAIARSLGQAREDNLAAVYAESRVERIAGTGCSSLSLGSAASATTRGVTEKYVVTDNGNNTLLLTDTLTWATRKSTRKLIYKTILPCRSSD